GRPASCRCRDGASAPAGRATEFLAELLDPAGLDDALLGARIERMRIRRDVELEQRIFLAVVHLDRLARIGGRPGDELEAARHVLEDDVAILGVDTFFHGSLGFVQQCLGLCPAGPPGVSTASTARALRAAKTGNYTPKGVMCKAARAFRAGSAPAPRHAVELLVALGGPHLVEQELHSG